MADPLTHLKQRSGDDWLIGYDSQEFFGLTERVLAALRSRPASQPPLTILLAERDPLTFLAHFLAACAANCHIFLVNPDWVTAEWRQVLELVQPDLIWGEAEKVKGKRQKAEGWSRESGVGSRESGVGSQKADSSLLPSTFYLLPSSPTPYIMIPTGGTSGSIRFVVHTWETLMASVQGFCDYFEVEQVNSFCVLPLYHVSGLMQFMRSFTTGGKLLVMPFKALEAGDRPSINPEDFFLSLVPTQLQRLLDRAGSEEEMGRQGGEEDCTQNSKLPSLPLPPLPISPSYPSTPHTSIAWLARFHTILLGGAPAWLALLDRARRHSIRLAPTYGMTETASQIATLKPDDFLKGYTNAGHSLPHARITIRNPSGEVLPPHQIGHITIQAKSLAIGYYPMLSTNRDCLGVGLSFSPQLSCSGGLGELGPQKAGDRGEAPRTQSLNEAEMLANQNSKQQTSVFQPDDLGFLDTDGYLHIVGRQTDKIITGGENVFPAEIEAAIRSTALVQDVCVIGISDRYWGQAITAVYIPINATFDSTAIQTALKDKLSPFKRPKHWLAVDRLPRNAQGKVNRATVEAIANQTLPTVPTID